MRSQQSDRSPSVGHSHFGNALSAKEETRGRVSNAKSFKAANADMIPVMQDQSVETQTPEPEALNSQSPKRDSSQANGNPLMTIGKAVLTPRKSTDTLPRLTGVQADQGVSPAVELMNRTAGQGTSLFPFAHLRDEDASAGSRLEPVQLLSSVETARFRQRQKHKTKKAGSTSPYGILYSTLQKSNQSSKDSGPNGFRFDMAIGIKAKREQSAGSDAPEGAARQVNRSVRKTVTIDYSVQHTDDLTNSVASADEPPDTRLNEEVQTAGDLEEQGKQDDKKEAQPLQPTVISLTNLTEDGLPGAAALENFFLGTPPKDGDKRPYVGRLASVHDSPSVAVLDHLASQGISQEIDEDTDAHLQKLRKILLKAMKMSRTSADKSWNQMTPFERAKIKDCFQELVKKMHQGERRTGRTGVQGPRPRPLRANPNADLIQELNDCLSSQPISHSRRPLHNNPLLSVHTRVQDGLNPDLLVPPALHAALGGSTTRFEHFVYIDDRKMQVPAPGRMVLTKIASPGTRGGKSSLGGWEPGLTGSFTPKFDEKRESESPPSSFAKMGSKMKKQKKARGSRKASNASPSPTRLVVTKSQATDTQLDDFHHKIQRPSLITFKAHQKQSDGQTAEHPSPPTEMRGTPNQGGANEINSDRGRQISNNSQLQHAIDPLYATGGPAMFSTEEAGTYEAAESSYDAGLDSRQLVPDVCLNSTLTRQIDIQANKKHTQAEQLDTETAEDGDSVMTPLVPSKLGQIEGVAPPDETVFDLPEATHTGSRPYINPSMDLPKMVKYIKRNIPAALTMAAPQEQPDEIVAGTLQAISLTKQYQAQMEAEAAMEEQALRQSQLTQLMVNSDISGVQLSASKVDQKDNRQFLSRKAYLDSIMHGHQDHDHGIKIAGPQHEVIDEQTSENFTSAMRDRASGSIINSTHLSGPVDSVGEKKVIRSGESSVAGLDLTMNQKSSFLGDNLEIQARRGVTRSPTHKVLGQEVTFLQKSQFSKIAALSKFNNPSAQNSKTLVQVESTTEKSSLNPQYMMKSKLGASNTAIQQPSIIKAQALYQQHQKINQQIQDRHMVPKQPLEAVRPRYQLQEQPKLQPQPKIIKKPQWNKTQTQKFFGTGKLAKGKPDRVGKRASNGLSGWELTNNSSSVDMLVTNLKNSSPGIIQCHASAVQSKLQLLESRMAEHNIEEVLKAAKIPGPGGDQASGGSPELQFSQLMTHAALRRSYLKGRTSNQYQGGDSCAAASRLHAQGEYDLANLNLGVIMGTKKDLAAFNSKHHPVNENNSRLTAKIAETENLVDKSQEQSAAGPAGQVISKRLTESSVDAFEPQMVEIKPINLEASELIKMSDVGYPLQQKQHGSFSKLVTSPRQKMSKVRLESSTSNPSIMAALTREGKIPPIQGLSHGNHSLQKMTLQADSQNSDAPSPAMKMQGTQAFAATPSKVSEGSEFRQLSGKRASAQQKRKPIQNVSKKKLHMTQGAGFDADKASSEFFQLIHLSNGADAINGSEDATETQGEDAPLRATMQINEESHRSLRLDGETTEDERPADAPLSNPDHNRLTFLNSSKPEITEHSFSQQLQKQVMGNRSQSLVPPTVSVIISAEHTVENRQASAAHKPTKEKEFSILKAKKKTGVTDGPIFSEDQHAPKQTLPKMQPSIVVEGGGPPLRGLKQDLRTPLHKLLTSEMMEEFQSLLGSKTYRRKQARLKGHLTEATVSPPATKQPMNSSVNRSDEVSRNTVAKFNSMLETNATTFRETAQPPKMALGQQLPTLRFPPFNQTLVSEFGDGPFSKRNTDKHVKRVQGLAASKDNRVIYIDPLAGSVHVGKKGAGMNSTSPKFLKDQRKMFETHGGPARKMRGSPFQATGPFSPQSTHQVMNADLLTASQEEITVQSANKEQQMPQLSSRYKSQARRASDVPTFIFNDINNLASSMRKNSQLVKPIFQSLQ